MSWNYWAIPLRIHRRANPYEFIHGHVSTILDRCLRSYRCVIVALPWYVISEGLARYVIRLL